jgi:hypothetical protein
MQEFTATLANTALTARRSSAMPPGHLRGLQSAFAVHKIDIFVSLEYLRDEVATSFEINQSEDPVDPVVAHFCRAVNYQVCALFLFINYGHL